MALKQLIGEVLSDLGFVTQKQLEAALSKQREITNSELLPEKLQRTRMVAEARFASKAENIPLLGDILHKMGYITMDQLVKALKQQEIMLKEYSTIESDALCSVMDMGALVNTSLNLIEVLSLIMKNASKVTHSTASTLMLLEEDTGELIFSVPTGPKADELMDIRIKKGQGIAGWVVEHGEPVVIPDVKKDRRHYSGIDKKSGFETKSILAVPMKAKTKLIGVLEAINKENGGTFSDQDALLLSIFASQAAMAIENARLYGELKDELEKRNQMEWNLAELEKFRALGQLSAGVAHDFNNILAAITGYSEMALDDISNEPQVHRSIKGVLKASYRAKKLVNQILTFSRQSSQEKVPIQSNRVVKEIIKLLRATVPSTIEIIENITPNAGTLVGDPTQFHQVLMNLCTNAYHAIGEKPGSIRITLSPVVLDATETGIHNGLKPGHFVKLCVSDDGCGMDQSTMEQIFEPYFTTKEKDVGTGMGLAMVHGIVKSNGGAVKVFSETGKGSTFEVLFPVVDLDVNVEEELREPLPTGTEHILFIDDEEAIIDIWYEALSKLGYSVTAKTNPLEAIEAFSAEPEAFDLIITDMTMPKITGDKVAAKMMDIRPDIPVILCTGFREPISEKKAKAIGIRAFALKPFESRYLSNLVRKVLDE